jgi:LPS sulfotransferase NodH
MILDDNEVALAGPHYDQPPSPLRRFVVIAATARTGSYMLARMLRELGYGIGLEYYNSIYTDGFARRWGVERGPSFWLDYLDAIIRHRTTNGFCVVKCMPWQWSLLHGAIKTRGNAPGLCYIHIWRRDTLAQAISLRLAYQSGLWNFTAEPTTPPNAAMDVCNLDALKEACRQVTVPELEWRVYLRTCGVPVAHVAYENLVADRDRELRRLVAFIDPERALPSPLPVDEPSSGEGLRARQQLSEAERAELRRDYEERFGAATPMPDP